jgi:hypothetical protein
MKKKNTPGCSAIHSQWICADTIHRATQTGPRRRLFGFRNRGFAARKVKQEAYTIGCSDF